jgi:hypothetical protein
VVPLLPREVCVVPAASARSEVMVMGLVTATPGWLPPAAGTSACNRPRDHDDRIIAPTNQMLVLPNDMGS